MAGHLTLTQGIQVRILFGHLYGVGSSLGRASVCETEGQGSNPDYTQNVFVKRRILLRKAAKHQSDRVESGFPE